MAVALAIGSAVSLVGAASAGASPGTQLDATFGDAGVVVATAGAEATSVAVQPNGAILVGGSVVAGSSAANAGPSGVVTRLRPDGSLDPSFGQDGNVPLPNLSPVIQVTGLADGSILALGGLLVGITPDGAGDPGFGQDGRALFPPSFAPARFATEPDGTLAVLGTATRSDGSTGLALAHLGADGHYDPTFGAGGVAFLAQSSDPDGDSLSSPKPAGLAIAAGGAIVVMFTAKATCEDRRCSLTPDASIAERVTADGTVDQGFGHGGQVLIGRLGQLVGRFDPIVTGDGTILTAIVYSGGTGAFTAPGTYAISNDGRTTTPPGDLTPLFARVGAFLPLPDGGYILRWGDRLSYIDATLNSSASPLIGRQEPFALPPGASSPDTLLAVQSDGKLLVAGSATAANGQRAMLVARLLGISQADVGLPAQRIRRSTRTVQVRLACSPVQNCEGEAALAISRRHRPEVVGHGSFSIHSGASAVVAMTLTHSGRARLARRRATRATLTLDPQNGPERVLRITIAPRRR